MNALDAFVSAYNNVSTLRQQFEPGDRVHGVIDEGGAAPNVIPDRTVSRWIVRARTAERFEALRARVLACFDAVATVTSSGESAIRDGALAMAHTIIDLATEGLWDDLET